MCRPPPPCLGPGQGRADGITRVRRTDELGNKQKQQARVVQGGVPGRMQAGPSPGRGPHLARLKSWRSSRCQASKLSWKRTCGPGRPRKRGFKMLSERSTSGAGFARAQAPAAAWSQSEQPMSWAPRGGAHPAADERHQALEGGGEDAHAPLPLLIRHRPLLRLWGRQGQGQGQRARAGGEGGRVRDGRPGEGRAGLWVPPVPPPACLVLWLFSPPLPSPPASLPTHPAARGAGRW